MQKKSLEHVLYTQTLSFEQSNQILMDVAAGLHFLHERGYVHGDIKSLNILLDNNGRAKIADLEGIVTVGTMSDIVTYAWAPPEDSVYELSVTSKFDIYNYGMLMLRLFLDNTLFLLFEKDYDGDNFVDTHQRNGRYKKLINAIKKLDENKCPLYMAQLMIDCLHPNPVQRPNVSQLIERLKNPLAKIAELDFSSKIRQGEIYHRYSHMMLLREIRGDHIAEITRLISDYERETSPAPPAKILASCI